MPKEPYKQPYQTQQGPADIGTPQRLKAHLEALLAIPGAELLYGGEEIQGHNIPARYGAFVPTAVKVPLKELMASDERFHLVTTEVFAPFQIVTEYDDSTFNLMLDCVERIDEHLTAAIVSNDLAFQVRARVNLSKKRKIERMCTNFHPTSSPSSAPS